MKEVYSDSNPSQVALYQSVLEEARIPYLVRNDLLQNMLVGPEGWASLCVVEDEDYPEAMGLLQEAQKEPMTTSIEWTCAACGEKVPSNFTSCWNCQTERHAKPV